MDSAPVRILGIGVVAVAVILNYQSHGWKADRKREQAEVFGDILKFGRKLEPESQYNDMNTSDFVRRRQIMKETLKYLAKNTTRVRLRETAMKNVERWAGQVGSNKAESSKPKVFVFDDDWGAVAARFTRQYGKIFAILNSANANLAGGGYLEGMPAQEENMFRRTDCHFSVTSKHFDQEHGRYRESFTQLLEASEGRVYLDTQKARICVRGREDRGREDLGYEWLREDQIFPFYELRSAATNLNGGRSFKEDDMIRRINAQFETLVDAGIRHVILGAFGCGGYMNPAREVAKVYKQALANYSSSFDVVAFAIHNPGFGSDNYKPFQETLL